MSDLPNGWIESSLLNLISDKGLMTDGDWVESKDQDPDGDVRLIQLADIGDGTFLNKSSRFLTSEKAEELRCTFLQEGDLLIARMPDPLGRACLFPQLTQKSVTVVDVCVWRSENGGADTKWLMYIVNSPDIRSKIQLLASGTTRQRVSGKNLKTLSVPLPPLAEQKRIVTKLDSLFAHTRRARQELDHIPKLIERYKQAILSAAFRGDLTADWRKEENLIDWQEIKLGELIADIQSGKNLKCEERPPRPTEKGVVKISAVTWGEFQPNNSKTFLSNFEPDPTSLIQIGDFLISRANTLELVGACVIVNETPGNLYLSDKVLRLCMPDKLKYWVLYFLRSDGGRTQIESSSTGNQLSMRNISQSAIRALEIPIPSEYEREIILAKINKDFQAIDRLEQEYQKAIKFLDRLEQSTLAKAFRGEIVPQDPNDEPASILLERIQKERENQQKNKKRQLSLFKEK